MFMIMIMPIRASTDPTIYRALALCEVLHLCAFFFLVNLFIFGCVGSLLRYAGFSLQWLLLLRSTGSRRAGFSSCGTRALAHRLSSCGARASALRAMWDLPGPGIEPMSPALAGGFLTTAAPGKSLCAFKCIYLIFMATSGGGFL